MTLIHSVDLLLEAKGPRLSLTKAQARLFDWALDAMEDYADDPDSDFVAKDLPVLRGTSVQFTMSKEVVEDLIYRFRNQLSDMMDQLDDLEMGSQVRMQNAILKKMRTVANQVGADW